MLFESIVFQNGLPFSVCFSSILEENYHCHREMEINFVLQGTTHYKLHNVRYSLKPGDIIIADVEDLHQIYDSSKNICMLQIHIDMKYFEKDYPDISYMFFVCEECIQGTYQHSQELQNKLSFLRQHLARLMLAYSKNPDNRELMMSEIAQLIRILVSNFQSFYLEDFQYKPNNNEVSPIDLERMCRINKYLLQNYEKKITLKDVAEMEHLNPYYVSHLIKNISGTNFQNFLNALRVEFAEMMLIDSGRNLTQISEACGFSTPNYFNKCFAALHGISPTEYRRTFIKRERRYGKPLPEKKALAILRQYLPLSDSAYTKNIPPQQLKISLDYMKSAGENFSDIFPRRLIISSEKDLLKISRFKDAIHRMNFRTLALDHDYHEKIKTKEEFDDIMSMLLSLQLPVETLTSSLRCFTEKIDPIVRPANAAGILFSIGYPGTFLSGTKDSLITPDGFHTPFYYICEALSDTRGFLTLQGKNHLAVKSKGMLTLILFNENPDIPLNVSIEIKNLPRKCFISMKYFRGQDNCYDILAEMGSPSRLPARIKEQMNASFSGRSSFSSISDTDSIPLNLDISPESLTVMEFTGSKA